MELRLGHFINPHNGRQEIQRISSLGGLSEDDEQDRAISKPIDPEAIKRFNEYFGSKDILAEWPEGILKTGEENMKADSDKSILRPDTAPAFRLVSSKLGPQPISLQIQRPVVRSQSPATQDTSKQRHLRRSQAAQAAIEVGAIGMQSTFKNPPDRVVRAINTSAFIEPAVAVLISGDAPGGVKTKVQTIQTAPVALERAQRSKRKRFKSKKSRLRAAFFRPDPSMGPRATGYAYGYQGSWMVKDPSKVPYERDKMKRGRFASP